MQRAFIEPCPRCEKAGTIAYPETDARGIYIGYSCEGCLPALRRQFDPRIFRPNYSADEPFDPEPGVGPTGAESEW